MRKKVSDFSSDYFFHYLMHHCIQLRLALCRYLSYDDTIQYTTIENSDTYSTHKGGKKRILDVVVKDDKNRYYNFEMQNDNIKDSDMKRFQIYAMRLVEKQMIAQETLNELNEVRQLIIYTGKGLKNLNYYHHRMELYDKKYQVMLEKGLIIMNIMQLDKMEEEEMEVMRRDINQVMKLFRDEEAHKEEQESELAKEVVKVYEQFIASKDYYDYIAMERDRWYYNSRLEESHEDGVSEGKAKGKQLGLIEGESKGKELGIAIGKREEKLCSMKIAMQEIYQRCDLDWLDELTFEQLEKGFKLIFKGLEYDELKYQMVK